MNTIHRYNLWKPMGVPWGPRGVPWVPHGLRSLSLLGLRGPQVLIGPFGLIGPQGLVGPNALIEPQGLIAQQGTQGSGLVVLCMSLATRGLRWRARPPLAYPTPRTHMKFIKTD